MATCQTCLHREANDGVLRCRLHDVYISSYSWCGCHVEAYQSFQKLVSRIFSGSPARSQRVTDFHRSAEDIHE